MHDGPGWLTRYSDSLRSGRYEDRIPVRTRFSAPVPTGPGGPPNILYYRYEMSLSGVKRPKCGLTAHPHLAPRLEKSITTSLLPVWAFITCSRANFTFFISDSCRSLSSVWIMKADRSLQGKHAGWIGRQCIHAAMDGAICCTSQNRTKE
jgi:hypothetical protein